jgi:repressor of nif and glnA expression
MPEAARDLILQLAKRLSAIGLAGFVEIGSPGQSLMGVPPSEGLIGSVVIGGLNPIAILEESGYRARSRALAGLLDYHRLFPFEQLSAELNRL